MENKVSVRFTPSITGYLYVEGLRTALCSYPYACELDLRYDSGFVNIIEATTIAFIKVIIALDKIIVVISKTDDSAISIGLKKYRHDFIYSLAIENL